MGFLNAVYITGIFLVIVPVILHLWRRRTENIINFPAVKYLIRAQQRFKKNIVFSDIFLMLLRGILLIFLTIAMSQPYAGSPFLQSEKHLENTAILIDTSMSMCADGFIKKAKSIASEIKNSYPKRILIVTFNDLINTFSKSGRDNKIIDELKCTYNGTDIYNSLREIADILGEGEKLIYLITDMTENGWTPERIATLIEERHINLIIADVRDDLNPKNYFVRDFRTEEIPEGTKIHIKVDSTSELDEEISVSLNLDDSTKLQTFTHPGKDVEFTLQSGSYERGFIELSGDELKEDNRYFFFLNKKKRPKILIVDGEPDIRPFRGESYFLLRAISALKEKFPSEVTVITPSALMDFPVFNYNIFFLLNVPQLQKKIVDRIMDEVKKGVGLCLTSGNNTDSNWFNISLADKIRIISKGLQEGEFHAGQTQFNMFFKISKWDEKLFQDIFFKKRILFIPEELEIARTTLSFSDGAPAVIESTSGDGVIIIFASTLDTEWTNLPLSGVFVPFLHEILLKLSAGGKPITVKNLLIGQQNIVSDKILNRITLIDPDGEKRDTSEYNNFIKADLDKPGIWQLGNYILTVNTDPQESHIKKLDKDELKKILGKRVRFYEEGIMVGKRETFKPLWQYFIILFGIFIVIESIISGRRG